MDDVISVVGHEDIPRFYNSDGVISIWDDPSARGGIRHTKHYKPITTLAGIHGKYERGMFDSFDITMLKVLGDAMCCNEDQLRRYMSSKLTSSQVSKRLKRFRNVGLADRWHIRSELFPDEQPPSAPFSIGIAGFTFLKNLYHETFFMKPEKWFDYGIRAAQRYVALNEIRCQLVEAGVLRRWVFDGVIANNPRLTRPHGVAEIETKNGNLNLVIERAQQGKDFLSFFNTKLQRWPSVFDKYGFLPIRNMEHNNSIVVFYCSSRTMMSHIYKELQLVNPPFTIWYCVEEDLMKNGLDSAFYIVKEGKFRPIRLSSIFV